MLITRNPLAEKIAELWSLHENNDDCDQLARALAKHLGIAKPYDVYSALTNLGNLCTEVEE